MKPTISQYGGSIMAFAIILLMALLSQSTANDESKNKQLSQPVYQKDLYVHTTHEHLDSLKVIIVSSDSIYFNSITADNIYLKLLEQKDLESRVDSIEDVFYEFTKGNDNLAFIEVDVENIESSAPEIKGVEFYIKNWKKIRKEKFQQIKPKLFSVEVFFYFNWLVIPK